MRIDVHDRGGGVRVRVQVDPEHPPSVVKVPGAEAAAIALDWNQALDDRGRLRRCPVCGHDGFYAKRAVPQITWFAAVLALVLAAVLLTYGGRLSTPAWIALAVLLLADLAIWCFAPRTTVCYRCDAEFRQTPVPRGTGPWDPSLAATGDADGDAP